MSNRTELHDKIQQITAKIIDLNSQFAKAERLTELDIDLLRRYTVDLYDAMHQLTPGQTQPPVVTVPPTPKVQPVVQEEKKEVPPTIVANEPKAESTPLPEKQEIPVVEEPQPVEPVVVEEPIAVETPDEPEPQVEEPVAETAPQPVDEVEETPTPTPPPAPKAAEEEETKETSLNDLLQKTEGNDLVSKLQQTPIHDLKKAISINKKFEFINQLFKGDHEAYTKSVHYINGLSTGNEATSFFNSLRKQYVWNDEDKLFLEFADLVRRRFM